MINPELLLKLWVFPESVLSTENGAKAINALRAVVELHKPDLEQYSDGSGCLCNNEYPCPTIQAIENELM